MKKIGMVLMIMSILLLNVIPVRAAHYEIRELIPVGVETTIVTKNFSYKDLIYREGAVEFKGIKNLTYETKHITISIGLFDQKKKNIGTLNFCSNDTLDSKEETAYFIRIGEEILSTTSSLQDIKYISILGDNENCRITGNLENIGQTVEEIGTAKNNKLDTKASLTINVLMVLGIIVVGIFIYSAVFTKSYQNMDGNSVRKGYNKVHKKMKERREAALKNAPPKPVEKVTDKSEEVIQQEQNAKEEEETDLQKFYK